MPAKLGGAFAATVTAVAAPMLLGHWMLLGQGLFAQILAVALWCLAAAAWTLVVPGHVGVPWRALRPLLLALGGVACGVAVSAAAHPPPPGVWLGSLGVLAAAALLAAAGARVAAQDGPSAERATRALMWGLVIAALASLVVSALQLVAPERSPSLLVAPARTPGRASGNLDQPSHLALLLLWAWLAVAAWPAREAETAGASPATAPDAATTAFAAPAGGSFVAAFALQAGLVATASRAGVLTSMVIGLWAALDRRLPRPTAWLLWITALVGVAMTIGRAIVTPAASLGAGASLVRPGARGGVFMDAVELIRSAPLTGVGWMEFQLAWSLTPLGDRGPRYFDHAHNLVMHLMAELGVPLGLAICAALIWGAVALLRGLKRVEPALQPRALMLAAMLGVIGLASLFDAPFWHAYLLLPSAWAWGCLVGMQAAGAAAAGAQAPPAPSATPGLPGAAPGGVPAPLRPAADARGRAGLVTTALALAAATLVVWLDFRQALGDRAAPGQGSRLFGYYADQRRAVAVKDAPPELFRSARWVWIDTQLLAAWVGALERAGRIEEARFLMQRSREFRDPAYGPWLAACRVVEPMKPPSRCLAPARPLSWQDFR
ncbi:MAG: O-antigen ligase family protein [Rubrivivax sp.]|nr:O-antigen ligase family protein [Rubrivivax sp.]